MTSQTTTEIHYPDSDGKLMADNTKQFEWITRIKGNLDAIFQSNPHVFVAGDLLWYPVEGNPKIRVAPDVMVAFGPAKGDRGSYKQWQENHIAPQVVFEILSPGNSVIEMLDKLYFYERYGVEEYYLYDPDENRLQGWQRQSEWLHRIDDLHNRQSPRLGVRFELTTQTLHIYRPDGTRFESFPELHQRADRLAERLRQMGIDPDTIT